MIYLVKKKEEIIKQHGRHRFYVHGGFMILVLFLSLSFVSAMPFGYDYLSHKTIINYSKIPTVNNSLYLQGLSPTQVANLFYSPYLYNQTTSAIDYSNNNFLKNIGDTGNGNYTLKGTKFIIEDETYNNTKLEVGNFNYGTTHGAYWNSHSADWLVIGNNRPTQYGKLTRIDINANSIFMNGIMYPGGDITESRKGDAGSTGSQYESYRTGWQTSVWDGIARYLAYQYIFGTVDTSKNERRGIKFLVTKTSSNIAYYPLTIWNDDNIDIPNDNEKLRFGAGQDAGIYYDGTNLIIDSNLTGNGIAWFSSNISAKSYITRTSVYDKSKGSALSKIKDADELVDINKKTGRREINHTAFYGFVKYNVTDYSRPVFEMRYGDDGKGRLFATYPHKKIEQGVNLNSEINLLKQAIYELKQQNNLLNSRIKVLEKWRKEKR